MKKVLGILMFLLMVGMVSATVESPIIVDQNTDCADLGYNNQLKIEPPVTGTYSGITFTLDDDLKHFDWSSVFGVDAVIAKGGPEGNAYLYYPSAMSGNDLVSPTMENGKVPDLSHATFCWNNEVPEFGVIAGAAALVGAIGIFLFRRK